MKLSERSYPHPVVGNRDDVPDASFQAALDISFDQEFLYIDASISNGSDTLDQLVDEHRAVFALHVECSNTMHRSLHKSSASQFRVAIPKDQLNHTVEVNAFVVALHEINAYSVRGQHSDYGEHLFTGSRPWAWCMRGSLS